MHCRVKLLRDGARLPTKAHATDSGFDLYSPTAFVVDAGEAVLIDTGIAIELPPGFGAVVRSRSSQAKRRIFICGGTGTVDPGYRGAIGVGIANFGTQPYTVEVGDRIAQLVIERVYDFEMVEVLTLDPTDRGTSGFGSSGK